MEEYREAICPVCGRAMGLHYERPAKRVNKRLWYAIKMGEQPLDYWKEYLPKVYDMDKEHWGIIRGTGKDRFEITGYLTQPEDDIELFNAVKQALLRAVKFYWKKGWLTKEELEEALEE